MEWAERGPTIADFCQEGAPHQFLRQFVALFWQTKQAEERRVCACRIEQSAGWGDSRRHSPGAGIVLVA